MKFLLFDMDAILTYVSKNTLQSIEFSQGQRLIDHARGKLSSEIFEDTVVEYCGNDGIIFLGKESTTTGDIDENVGHKVFCIDLTQCSIMSESDSALLFVLQKVFRTTLKIWNRNPFSFSERVHGSKSIVFPFAFPDPRRIVIERSKNVLQLEKRSIDFPLLAYKYNAEDPTQGEETVDVSVLKSAGKLYHSKYYALQNKLQKVNVSPEERIGNEALYAIHANKTVGRDDFIYWAFEEQYQNLTLPQKTVVDSAHLNVPLRIDGAAGTGKTISMIMRAYKLLEEHRRKSAPFNVVFFSHSQSTLQRNLDAFRNSNYHHADGFLEDNPQHILFTTLSDYCANFAGIPSGTLLERDAGDAKTYQLMLIENVVEKANNANTIRTYRSLISPQLRDVFDSKITASTALCAMLQHEFSVQIKGRTDSTIDNYYKIPPIPNGLPCKTERDKELVFSLFCAYQEELKGIGAFDVDDVVIEALSRLNAPLWRRKRAEEGFDYIFVDEMHLFNINEQSVFHYLTKSLGQKDIPMCFALDYSQAIGDRGDIHLDYSELGFGKTRDMKYRTVFRNSPQITNFCSSIAASGVLMFHKDFSDPYIDTQSNFVPEEEKKSATPSLYEYNSDDEMIDSLRHHIDGIMRDLCCKPTDIAVIAFDPDLYSAEGVSYISDRTRRGFISLSSRQTLNRDTDKNCCIIASPYDINGLEFQAVILLGVDEGRVPQTMGTSDISQHFIKYSAYNLLYLSASRAKYRLIILGNKLKGRSTCLNHSIEAQYLITGE